MVNNWACSYEYIFLIYECSYLDWNCICSPTNSIVTNWMYISMLHLFITPVPNLYFSRILLPHESVTSKKKIAYHHGEDSNLLLPKLDLSNLNKGSPTPYRNIITILTCQDVPTLLFSIILMHFENFLPIDDRLLNCDSILISTFIQQSVICFCLF